MQSKKTYISHSEEETLTFAKEFCKYLQIGDVVVLTGNLGTGKTLFINGICNSLHVDEIVTSPTFTIMNQYIGYKAEEECNIIHIDLYRIKNIKELIDLGFLELLSTPKSIILIEWGEKAEELIPKPYHRILFENTETNDNHRLITFEKVE